MTTFKKFGAVLLGGIIGVFGLELAGRLPILGVGGLVSTAEASSGASTHPCQCRRRYPANCPSMPANVYNCQAS